MQAPSPADALLQMTSWTVIPRPRPYRSNEYTLQDVRYENEYDIHYCDAVVVTPARNATMLTEYPFYRNTTRHRVRILHENIRPKTYDELFQQKR